MTSNLCPVCEQSQSYRFITETADMRVIYPKSPKMEYHLLITPKKHRDTMDQLSPAEGSQLIELLSSLVSVVKEKVDGFIGYNLVSNNGSKAVNQYVNHAHLHVFLRRAQDPDPLTRDAKDPVPLNEEQLKTVETIKNWFNA